MKKSKLSFLLSFPVFFALAAGGAFFPVLFLGRAYFANDLLYFFGPHALFLREQLFRGSIPLWNPYVLGGQPFLADLQNLFFYPPQWFCLLLPFPAGLGFFQAFHAWLAAFGMALFLQHHGLGKTACRLGGVLYAFSLFMWWELIHPPVLAAFAWIPWLFFAIERFLEKPCGLRAFFCGLTFALLFLGGSLQVLVGAFWSAAAYFLFRLLGEKRAVFRGISKKKLLFHAAAIFFGLLPLFLQALPTLEFSKQTFRGEELPYTFNAQYNLQPKTLVQFLFPQYGLPEGQTVEVLIQNTQDWLANFGYLGLWVPFLALFALFCGNTPKRSVRFFFFACALLFLFISFGKYSPIHRVVTEWLPGFDRIRVAFRFLYFYVFSLAFLAASAFHDLENQKDVSTPRWFFPAWGAYGIVLFFTALSDIDNTWIEILSLGCGVLALSLRHLRLIPGTQLLFFAALTFPLFLNGWKTFSTGPYSNYAFREKAQALSTLAQELQGARVSFQPYLFYPVIQGNERQLWMFPENACSLLGLRSLGGYNPLTLKRTDDLKSLSSKKVWELFNVHGFLSFRDYGELVDFEKQETPVGFYYRLKTPPSGVRFPKRIVSVRSFEEVLKTIPQEHYHPETDALWIEKKGSTLPPPSPEKGEAALAALEPNRQTWKIRHPTGGLVVFSEVFYPGWRASIDKQPADLWLAEGVFCAVVVPSGTHEVSLEFRPAWWPWLAFLGIFWLVCSFFLLKITGGFSKIKNSVSTIL